ncbi:MAG: LysR family transcriptional regulator [Planctomycetes bacterium]|nr:LysR family transcriptional regulator [Planctomycetota bacterium]
MNLQTLEVFCEVAREESFSRGGAACGITQSAASQLMAHLERKLGFRLIDRKRRPLRLTAEGEVYYRGCQEILRCHRTTLEKVQQGRKDLSGTVRVASIYSTGLHTLTRYREEFLERYPQASVRLEYLHPTKVYDAVLNDEADIGVISYPRPRGDLRVLRWVEEEMVLVSPPSHPLSRRRKIRVRELEGVLFVTFDRDLKIRQEIDRALRKLQVKVQLLSEFDNIETIKGALEISSAVSILPRPSVEREARRGTFFLARFEDLELRRPVGIIHRRRHGFTPTCERFLACLLEGADES